MSKFRNGFHAHHCPKCQQDVVCAIITHCRRPDPTPCDECRAQSFILGKTEEAYCETGKWPKE